MAVFNFDALVTEIDGKLPTTFVDGKETQLEIPLRKFIAQSLCAQYQDEPGLDGLERLQRGRIAEKIIQGGDVNLSIEEQAMVKKCVLKGVPTPSLVKIIDILEPPESH